MLDPASGGHVLLGAGCNGATRAALAFAQLGYRGARDDRWRRILGPGGLFAAYAHGRRHPRFRTRSPPLRLLTPCGLLDGDNGDATTTSGGDSADHRAGPGLRAGHRADAGHARRPASWRRVTEWRTPSPRRCASGMRRATRRSWSTSPSPGPPRPRCSCCGTTRGAAPPGRGLRRRAGDRPGAGGHRAGLQHRAAAAAAVAQGGGVDPRGQRRRGRAGGRCGRGGARRRWPATPTRSSPSTAPRTTSWSGTPSPSSTSSLSLSRGGLLWSARVGAPCGGPRPA